MPRKTMLGKLLCIQQGGADAFRRHGSRWMVGKAGNRAAVHGSKLPIPSIIPAEEVEMEIKSSTEQNEKQRMKMENTVDSHLKKWQVILVEDIVSSSN